jgi:hypothetical protein
MSLAVLGFGRQAIEASPQSVAVPRLITFGGVAKSGNGDALSGVAALRFSLYRDQQGGTPLWSEIQNVNLDPQGRYTALLGATKAEGIAIELFASGEPRWLGVQVELPGEQEQPRILLSSVPYAMKAADADTIGGKPLSAFVLADSSFGTGPVSAVSSLKGVADVTSSALISGTANTIAKFTNATDLGDSVLYENNGRIGLGTTNPVSRLNVQTADNAADYFTLSAYNVNLFDKGFLVRAARGPSSAPTAVGINDILFNLYAQGSFGVDYGISGGLTMLVDGAVAPGIVPGAILMQTMDAGGSFAERMRINSQGNVGIGTPAPTAKLEVGGNLKVSGGGVITGNGSGLTNLAVANLSGTIANSQTTAASTNTASSIVARDASGNFTAGTVTATAFSGNGSGLTNLAVANLSGTIANSQTTAASANTASSIVARDASGNFTAGTVTATTFSGNGSALTNVNAASLGGSSASALRTRAITYLGGCDTCSVLADTDDQKMIYLNVVGPMTITSVKCFSDAGTPTINIQRDDGSPADVLSSALSCSTSGGTSTSFNGSENILALNDKLDFVMVTAGGVAKRVTVVITATVN